MPFLGAIGPSIVASLVASGGLALAMTWWKAPRHVLEMPRLSASQLQNARIITREFRAAGMSDAAIASAIVNAMAESALDTNAVGDGGNSVGLFQMHKNGAGRGMSVEERKNPVTNSREMLKREVLVAGGVNFRRAIARGASVAELSGIFARDIERCAACQGHEKIAREQRAVSVFGPHAKRVGWSVRLPEAFEVA